MSGSRLRGGRGAASEESNPNSYFPSQHFLLELKQRVLHSVGKLGDRDTQYVASQDLERVAESMPLEGLPIFLSCLYDSDGKQKSYARRECVRLFGVLAMHFEAALSPYLSKIVASMIRRFKDMDSMVSEACAETFAVLVLKVPPMANSEPGLSGLGIFFRPLLDSLSEQTKTGQAGAAVCLEKVIRSTEDTLESSLPMLIPRLSKYLRRTNFLAKAQLMVALRAIVEVTGIEISKYLSILMPTMRDVLASTDWLTRKTTCEALTQIVLTVGRESMKDYRTFILDGLEKCRFDKVKPVRDSAGEAIQIWREVPSHETIPQTPPPRKRSSASGTSPISRPSSDTTVRRTSIRSSPGRQIPAKSLNQAKSPNQSTTSSRSGNISVPTPRSAPPAVPVVPTSPAQKQRFLPTPPDSPSMKSERSNNKKRPPRSSFGSMLKDNPLFFKKAEARNSGDWHVEIAVSGERQKTVVTVNDEDAARLVGSQEVNDGVPPAAISSTAAVHESSAGDADFDQLQEIPTEASNIVDRADDNVKDGSDSGMAMRTIEAPDITGYPVEGSNGGNVISMLSPAGEFMRFHPVITRGDQQVKDEVNTNEGETEGVTLAAAVSSRQEELAIARVAKEDSRALSSQANTENESVENLEVDQVRQSQLGSIPRMPFHETVEGSGAGLEGHNRTVTESLNVVRQLHMELPATVNDKVHAPERLFDERDQRDVLETTGDAVDYGQSIEQDLPIGRVGKSSHSVRGIAADVQENGIELPVLKIPPPRSASPRKPVTKLETTEFREEKDVLAESWRKPYTQTEVPGLFRKQVNGIRSPDHSAVDGNVAMQEDSEVAVELENSSSAGEGGPSRYRRGRRSDNNFADEISEAGHGGVGGKKQNGKVLKDNRKSLPLNPATSYDRRRRRNEDIVRERPRSPTGSEDRTDAGRSEWSYDEAAVLRSIAIARPRLDVETSGDASDGGWRGKSQKGRYIESADDLESIPGEAAEASLSSIWRQLKYMEIQQGRLLDIFQDSMERLKIRMHKIECNVEDLRQDFNITKQGTYVGAGPPGYGGSINGAIGGYSLTPGMTSDQLYEQRRYAEEQMGSWGHERGGLRPQVMHASPSGMIGGHYSSPYPYGQVPSSQPNHHMMTTQGLPPLHGVYMSPHAMQVDMRGPGSARGLESRSHGMRSPIHETASIAGTARSLPGGIRYGNGYSAASAPATPRSVLTNLGGHHGQASRGEWDEEQGGMHSRRPSLGSMAKVGLGESAFSQLGSPRSAREAPLMGSPKREGGVVSDGDTNQIKQAVSPAVSWNLAVESLRAGNMDAAYLEVVGTGDSALLVRLMGRTGPVLGQIGQDAAVGVLRSLLQLMQQNSHLDYVLPWMRQLSEMVAESSPDCPKLSRDMKRQTIAALREVSAADSSGTWLGRLAKQLANQLSSKWQM